MKKPINCSYYRNGDCDCNDFPEKCPIVIPEKIDCKKLTPEDIRNNDIYDEFIEAYPILCRAYSTKYQTTVRQAAKFLYAQKATDDMDWIARIDDLYQTESAANITTILYRKMQTLFGDIGVQTVMATITPAE